MLGLDYVFCSNETKLHPTINFWSGSKDGYRDSKSTIVEYKAPFTKDSFCQLVRPLYHGLEGIKAMYAIRDGYNHEGFEYPAHTDGDKYYWQCVSNAIIEGVDFAELIVFMPYQSQLLDIMNAAQDDPAYNWMKYSADSIPFIKDGGFFKNLNVIRFKLPEEDKIFLTNQVLKAGEMLVNPGSIKSQAA